MKKVVKIETDRPIALYNSELKELVAVFRNPTLAAKYLFPFDDRTKSSSKVAERARCKSRFPHTRFGFSVAVRYANEEKAALLDGNDWFIANGYVPVDEMKMKGYTSTRADLKKNHVDRKR